MSGDPKETNLPPSYEIWCLLLCARIEQVRGLFPKSLSGIIQFEVEHGDSTPFGFFFELNGAKSAGRLGHAPSADVRTIVRTTETEIDLILSKDGATRLPAFAIEGDRDLLARWMSAIERVPQAQSWLSVRT